MVSAGADKITPEKAHLTGDYAWPPRHHIKPGLGAVLEVCQWSSLGMVTMSEQPRVKRQYSDFCSSLTRKGAMATQHLIIRIGDQ